MTKENQFFQPLSPKESLVSMERGIFRYCLKEIPDPGDLALASACGGDVRASAFQGSEQLLRLICSFPAHRISAGFRLVYQPDGQHLSRLRIELAVAASTSDPQETAKRLISAGPMAAPYRLNSTNLEVLSEWALDPTLTACCEIVRREDGWRPREKRRRLNSAIPALYHTFTAFEPSEDNDWSAVDRLLDRFTTPAVVEIIVVPTDIREEREWHYRYLTRLRQVNPYSDDLSAEFIREEILGRAAPRKIRDPMADEVLRREEENHEKLREPHFHFAIRHWATNTEDAALLAAAVAGAALQGDRYRLLPFDRENEIWWKDVRASSERLDVSLVPLYSDVWDHSVGKGRQKLVRMSHLARVDELKGLFRLPVGSPHVFSQMHSTPHGSDSPHQDQYKRQSRIYSCR